MIPSRIAAILRRALCCAMLASVPTVGASAGNPLPSSPDAYLSQATRVRQANDRPWLPIAGRLGNLRRLQIAARDCVVRVVSGNENRVFPGTRDVIVVEESRVLDTDPHERPTPRDVLLAADDTQACVGPGSCGLSVTPASRAPRVGADGAACFTVQIATAHELALRGDGLTVLVDRVRQPALRVFFNPDANLRMWLEQVDIGLLSLGANAPVRVGGDGRVDFLQGSSSNGASAMYLHEFDARHVGVSSTTTGTRWSIRIDADTVMAGYHQPARAPGALAAHYGIEIDGPLERLEVPASRVDPRPLSAATRAAARTLRDEVRAAAGPAPELPAADLALPSASAAVDALPLDARGRVAQVVARHLPASVRITEVALWKQGGRLEGIAPDQATARAMVRALRESGEFTHVGSGIVTARDGGYAFTAQMYFSCEAPGEPSVCPAGDPKARDTYSEMQVIETLESLLAPDVALRDARLDDTTIHMTASAPSEAAARAGMERLRQQHGFFRTSISGIGPERGGAFEITATLELVCARPPRPDGICASRDTGGR